MNEELKHNFEVRPAVLRVVLKEVNLCGLIGMIDEMRNPYLKLKLGEKTIKSRVAKKDKKRVKYFYWWDKWEWKIKGNQKLEIKLFDKDISNVDHFLGECIINLKNSFGKGRLKKRLRMKRHNVLSAVLKLELCFEQVKKVNIRNSRILPEIEPDILMVNNGVTFKSQSVKPEFILRNEYIRNRRFGSWYNSRKNVETELVFENKRNIFGSELNIRVPEIFSYDAQEQEGGMVEEN